MKHRAQFETNIKFQNYNDTNLQRFRSGVENANWDVVLTENVPRKSYEVVMATLLKLYDTSFPLLKAKVHTKTRQPWTPTDILSRIKERNQVFQRFIKTRNCGVPERYKKHAKTKKTKCSYRTNKFYNIRHVPAKI